MAVASILSKRFPRNFGFGPREIISMRARMLSARLNGCQ
jgi:hypothetical protein